MRSRRRVFLLLWLGCITLQAAPDGPVGKCGTASMVQAFHRQAQKQKSLVKAPSMIFGRTLSNAHFTLHYTLSPTVHRAKLVPSDSTLKKQIDSVLTVLPNGLSSRDKDSALNATLDKIGASHPVYVLQTLQYLEKARSYYVDTLGMLAPNLLGGSTVFESATLPGRLPVDIADFGTATGLMGEYYGLTYPPPVSILLENDFLWNVHLGLNGEVVGNPVQSKMAGILIHNYDQEWELGLKVTLAHALYHVIQFAYTPKVYSYHAWYELSAVGMEERLAPDVNDYFQYLPCILNHLSTVPVLGQYHSSCSHPPEYGNAVFYQFLGSQLGPRFDLEVWLGLQKRESALTSSTSQLEESLLEMTQKLGVRWDSLFQRYAVALSTSGQPESGSLTFSSDMPRWPKPAFDSLPNGNTEQIWKVIPETVHLFRPSQNRYTGPGWLQSEGLKGFSKVSGIPGGNFTSQSIPGNRFPLATLTDTGLLFFITANPSWNQNGQVRLTTYSTSILAYPNPASLAKTKPLVFFSAPTDTPNTHLTLVSASGKKVADLLMATNENSWTWDLHDLAGRECPPGVYYFQSGNQPVEVLLVTPK